MRSPTIFSQVAATLFIVSCSESSTSGSAPGTTATTAPSCSDVCATIARLCGGSMPGCDSACSSFSNTQKTCANGAKACSDANACVTGGGGGGGATGDAGATSEGGATGDGLCSTCTSKQFCVTSSVSSEKGCYTPDDTCNGSSTDHCPCILAAKSPCSKGAISCSEGADNSVTCK